MIPSLYCRVFYPPSGKINIDLLKTDRNGGYSYGNNYGADYALRKYDSQYIAIANPDIQIDEDTFIRLLDTFDHDTSVGMCSPVMRDIHGAYCVYSQRLPQWKDDLGLCFHTNKVRTIITENYPLLKDNPNYVLTEMLPGSFFVAKSACYRKAGMLDEGVFLFCEERILGYRMKAAGYKLVLRADLFFTHIHSTSIGKAYKTINTQKLIFQSRRYYNRQYNKAGRMKLALLYIAQMCNIQSLKIIMPLSEMKHRLMGKRE